MNKCLIYPGTFDPIHYGHVSTFKEAYDILKPECSYFLLQDNRFKDVHMLSMTYRLDILKQVCHSLNHDGYPVVPIECQGSEYFIDAFYEIDKPNAKIKKKYEYDVLVGDDVLKTLKQWHEFETINRFATFIIAERHMNSDEIEAACLALKLKNWCILPIGISVDSTALRLEIKKKIIQDALQ